MTDPCRRLPPDVLRKIFLDLSLRDRVRSQRVAKSWRDSLTTDTALWTTRIDIDVHYGLVDTCQILQQALYYAFLRPIQDVTIDIVEISCPNPELAALNLLVYDLPYQRIKKINSFSLSVKYSPRQMYSNHDGYHNVNRKWANIYYLVPISKLTYNGKLEVMDLDHLLKNQAGSIEELTLRCRMIEDVLNGRDRFSCPLLKKLELGSMQMCRGQFRPLRRCPNLSHLVLKDCRVNIGDLFRYVPNTLQSLVFSDVTLAKLGGSWPENLTSLSFIRVTPEGPLSLLSGTLNKLVNLSVHDVNVLTLGLDNLLSKAECGSSLQSFDLNYASQVPDPILYLNVERLSIVACHLDPKFSSQCSVCTRLKDISLKHNNYRGDLAQLMLKLARNKVETIRVSDNVDESDIEKITSLGSTVWVNDVEWKGKRVV